MRLDPSADPRRRADLPDADLRELGRRVTEETIASALEHGALFGAWQYAEIVWYLSSGARPSQGFHEVLFYRAHAFPGDPTESPTPPICRAAFLEIGDAVSVHFGGPRPRVACRVCWRELHE